MSVELPKTQEVVLIDDISEGYDTIKYVTDYPVPDDIKDDEILVKNKYSGVNFIEAYFRKGIYPCEHPYILGREAVGTVVYVGRRMAHDYKVGDSVAYIGNSSMAQFTKVSAKSPIINMSKFYIEEELTDELFQKYCASLINVLTVMTFIRESYKVKKNDNILVYAAAGGVGLIFDQLITKIGATVIAVASSDDKLQLAKLHGAKHLINSSTDDIVEKVNEYTNGKGVEAVFDSIGKDTFETSMKVLRLKGTFVSFGNASGPVAPFPLSRLSPKVLKLVRPQLYGYLQEKESWDYYSKEFIRVMDSGELKINISKVYQLGDYKKAAMDLESRKTTGKLILKVPQ
ncbi:hypothetical protein TPHA_0M00930 [Tetrapisispora phaffii CBS 4417]|uniref:Probable quinone oxidoreductase n=1 Tax=Tetrapisispora phaffii (strain ATCC 24235 / CBS 4417 / NBRC 1672 / NRRL Y-8282 / UCD 70-5) TaxID=1071381 RepID=G8C0F3_TETPH|nr:hypothetical protein TPHA_0M00930 [Tetrapisispora phaffii CBS 4417]CCE65668.1 hypothetical protein TPHA_0M00930 [Tetrapisispora phaffii CBS 4417]